MPELPDLEVYRGNIFKRLTSKRLIGLKVFSMKITMPESILLDQLNGRALLSISRYGKELLFDFADDRIIAAHLMLNGKISIVDNTNTKAADKIKGKVFTLTFENESIIFHDSGRIGTAIRYKPLPSKVPDALGDDFTLKRFLQFAKRKSNEIENIKTFLIDQKVVKGIGNAYADEILWQARISPKSIVSKVPREAMTELYKAIGTVLHDAVDSIKAISPDIISGEERSFLKVHNKLIEKTETGFPIIVETVDTKITYFTEEQILYR